MGSQFIDNVENFDCYTKQTFLEQNIDNSLFSNYNTEAKLIYDGFVEDGNENRNLKIYLTDFYDQYAGKKENSILEGPINNNLNILSYFLDINFFPSFIISLYDNFIQGNIYVEVRSKDVFVNNFDSYSFKNSIKDIIIQNTSLNSNDYSRSVIFSNAQIINANITDRELIRDVNNGTEDLYITFSYSVIISLEVFGIDYKDSNYSHSRENNYIDYNLNSSGKEYYFITLHLPVVFNIRMKYSLIDKTAEFDVLNYVMYDHYFKEFKTNDLKNIFLFSLIQNKQDIDLLNDGDLITDLTPYGYIIYADYFSFKVLNYGANPRAYIGGGVYTSNKPEIFQVTKNSQDYLDICTIDVLNDNLKKICFYLNTNTFSFTNKQVQTISYELGSNFDLKLGEIEFLKEKSEAGEFLLAKDFIEDFYPAIYNLITNLSKQDLVDILVNGQKEFPLHVSNGKVHLKSIKLGREFIYWSLSFFVENPFHFSRDKNVFFNDPNYSNLKNWVINNFYFDNPSIDTVFVIFPNDFPDTGKIYYTFYSTMLGYHSSGRTSVIQSFYGINSLKSFLQQDIPNKWGSYLTSSYYLSDESMMFLHRENRSGANFLRFSRFAYTTMNLVPLKDAVNDLNIFNELKNFLSELFNINNYSYTTFMFFLNTFFHNKIYLTSNKYDYFFSDFGYLVKDDTSFDIISFDSGNKRFEIIPALDLAFSNADFSEYKSIFVVYEFPNRMTFNISNNITYFGNNVFVMSHFAIKSTFFITSFSYADSIKYVIYTYPQVFFYTTTYLPIIFKLESNNVKVFEKSINFNKVKESLEHFYENVFKTYKNSNVFVENIGLVTHPHIFPLEIIKTGNFTDTLLPLEIINTTAIDYKGRYMHTSYLFCLLNYFNNYNDICSKYSYDYIDSRVDTSFDNLSYPPPYWYRDNLMNTLNYIHTLLNDGKNKLILDSTIDTNDEVLDNDKVLYAYNRPPVSDPYPNYLKYFISKQTYLVNTNNKQYRVARLSGTDITSARWGISDSTQIKPTFVISNNFCTNSENDINLVYKEQIDTTFNTRLIGFRKSEDEIEIIQIEPLQIII